MLKKIIKKDNNEELEKILEEKEVNEQAKNLLQGILYKIEASYGDYKKVKGISKTEDEYVDQLVGKIKKRCNKINVVKISQDFENENIKKELRKSKYYISNNEIICYPIEKKLLYAIEKNSSNNKILNSKYGEATIAVSDFINTGKNIDRVEVLRDFNGWSWTTIKSEIENIQANLIYQILQITFSQQFMDDWCQDNDGIIDYFEIMYEDEWKIYEKETIDKLKELLIQISIINDIKENKEFELYVSKRLEDIKEKLDLYKDNSKYLEKIYMQKKQTMERIKDIELILKQKQRLISEFEKRNREEDISKKIFNISLLKKELNDEKNKLVNEVEEYNYLINPKNYIKEKEVLENEKNRLDVKEITQNQNEELLIKFIKCFLKCFNEKIKIYNEKEKILQLIYQFRYFMCLPFNEEKSVKEVERLEKSIERIEKNLVKKAIETKVIKQIPFEIMKHIFITRITNLEELYYKTTKEKDKYYIQIFDENITEEKFEIEKNEQLKLNKKIKIIE